MPFPSLEDGPLIKRTDKANVFHFPANQPEDAWKPKDWKHGDLVPLFWCESKSVDLYEALIKNYKIHSICDLSCHWALAAAALRCSVPYYGIAMSQEQALWTTNIADRVAARCICMSDHPLYHHHLSSLLAEHFSDAIRGPKQSTTFGKNYCPETPT